jgi:FkbM family methyltransferase
VLDVGANTGLYSLLAAAAHPDARVTAFEPYVPVAAPLGANLAHGEVGAILDRAGVPVL